MIKMHKQKTYRAKTLTLSRLGGEYVSLYHKLHKYGHILQQKDLNTLV